MDGVIVPTLMPPPLSPLSSFSSDSPPSSLRKSLSKKASLHKILSLTACDGLHADSIDAINTTSRSEICEETSTAGVTRKQTSSVGINFLLPSLVKNYSTEGSMDVDDYCAVEIDDGVNRSKPVTSDDEENEIESAVGDAGNSICSEDFHGNADELKSTESDDVSEQREDTPVGHTEAEEVTNADDANKNIDEDQMDTSEEMTTSEKLTVNDVVNKDTALSIPTSPPVTNTTPKCTSIAASTTDVGPPPIEILISFDTTGSMSYYLDEVKNEINNIIHRLFIDIPNLKIGVIAHGDYCDSDVYYLTQTMDLTSDVEGLCTMVKNVEGTGGGDFEECYELIMRMARQVKWTPGSRRALVLIGDACPHTTDDLTTMGKEPIDWKVEAAALRFEMGVQIYGVQCQDHKEAGTFWQDLSALTHGQHLKLDKFATIIDIILAICYREGGTNHLQAYELEVRAREGRMLATELDQAFQVLRGGPGAPKTDGSGPSGVPPASKVPPKPVLKTKKPLVTNKREQKQSVVLPTEKTSVKKQTKEARTARTKNQNSPARKRRPTEKSKPPVKKNLREQVTEAHFFFRQLKWTPWIKVLSAHDHGAPSIWQKRRSGNGYKLTENLGVLDKFRTRRAIYEVAVQLQPRGKQIIVYNHVTKGGSDPNGHWSRLVFRPKVNKFIDNAFRQCPHASISVRRAHLQGQRKLFGQSVGSAVTCRALINKMYDYAWKGRNPSRTLVKKGVTLAEKDTNF